MGKKKPDMVVDHPENSYYPTNLGAPKFYVPDVLKHKNERGVNASHYLETKFNELKEDYFKLIKIAEDTEMVFKSTYNFIPAVGNVYHLYKRLDNNYFLSIIRPDEWDMDHEGSFKFTSDNTWERQKNK